MSRGHEYDERAHGRGLLEIAALDLAASPPGPARGGGLARGTVLPAAVSAGAPPPTRARTVAASADAWAGAHTLLPDERRARLVQPVAAAGGGSRQAAYLATPGRGSAQMLDDAASVSAFDSIHSVDHGTLGASSMHDLSSGHGGGSGEHLARVPGRWSAAMEPLWHASRAPAQLQQQQSATCPNPDVVVHQVRHRAPAADRSRVSSPPPPLPPRLSARR